MMVVVKSARCACDDWYSTQARRGDARERERESRLKGA